jgi:hypothetical protein
MRWLQRIQTSAGGVLLILWTRSRLWMLREVHDRLEDFLQRPKNSSFESPFKTHVNMKPAEQTTKIGWLLCLFGRFYHNFFGLNWSVHLIDERKGRRKSQNVKGILKSPTPPPPPTISFHQFRGIQKKRRTLKLLFWLHKVPTTTFLASPSLRPNYSATKDLGKFAEYS